MVPSLSKVLLGCIRKATECSYLEFLPWLLSMMDSVACKSNKLFPPQAAFGHGILSQQQRVNLGLTMSERRGDFLLSFVAILNPLPYELTSEPCLQTGGTWKQSQPISFPFKNRIHCRVSRRSERGTWECGMI